MFKPLIMLASIGFLLSCTSVMHQEGQVKLHLTRKGEQKIFSVVTHDNGMVIKKIDRRLVKVLPNSAVTFFDNQEFDLEYGKVVISQASKNWIKKIELNKFLKPIWGGCQFLRLKIPEPVNPVKAFYQITYVMQDLKKTNLKGQINFLFAYRGHHYYGFFIPYNVYSKISEIDLKIKIHSRQQQVATILLKQAVLPKEFKTQKIYFKESKSKTLVNTDRKRYQREHQERKKIWAESNAHIYFKDDLIYPLEHYKYISSEFGLSRHWILSSGKIFSKNVHLGVDFAEKGGTQVNAAAGGIVRYAQDSAFMGNTVIIEHGFSLFTDYSHLKSINVVPGQVVKQGEKIGEVGMTGASTGNHLHWGARVYGIPVDPRSFLNTQAIFQP